MPQKIKFLEYHISAPKGCCVPKFLHAPQNNQVLLAHTPKGMGVPQQFFSIGGGQNWLKI